MNRAPKILYVSPNGYLGGAERFVYSCAKNHHSNQFECFYFFFKDGQCYEEVKKKCKTFLLPFPFKLSQPLSLLRACLYLRRFIKENEIDLIHSTMPYAHIVMSLATLFLSVKRVWFQHGPVGGTLDFLANLFPVDLIYFNSGDLKNRHNQMFLSLFHRDTQKVIPLGVELPASEHKKKEKQSLLFLSMGRLTPSKGQLYALKAFHKLFQDGFNISLLIIGSPNSRTDQAYQKELTSYVQKNKLEDHVSFSDSVTNPEYYLALSDFFIHSTVIPEAFGLLVAEAMLSKTLVIGGNLGGIQEILQNNKTGIVYNSSQLESKSDVLYQALKKAISLKEDQKEALLDNAYKLIQKRHNVQSMIEQLEKDYTNLLT